MPMDLLACCEGSSVPVTITQNLQNKKKRLEDELRMVNEAIAALESNPGVEAVLNTVAKVVRI